MRAHSALSAKSDVDQAIAEVCADLDFVPDLCFAFATPGFGSLDELPARLSKALGGAPIVGGSGSGVLADGLETETGAALAVAMLDLGGATASIRTMRSAELPSDDGPPSAWAEAAGAEPSGTGGLLVCADPFSIDAEALLRGLDFGLPNTPKIGGMISGAGPGRQTLFCGDEVQQEGAVTVAFDSSIWLEPVVARGCRPLGRTGTISSARGQVVHRIDDRPALDFLREQAAEVQGGALFLGVESDPLDPTEPANDDFLIRNLVGTDGASGAVAVGAHVGAGRRVRLHVRDRDASRSDLHDRLEQARSTPELALLFSCLGRGQSLFGERHHDSTVLRQRFPGIPIVGEFCNGEIGPVGGVTYLHGYTASIALLSGRTQAES